MTLWKILINRSYWESPRKRGNPFFSKSGWLRRFFLRDNTGQRWGEFGSRINVPGFLWRISSLISFRFSPKNNNKQSSCRRTRFKHVFTQLSLCAIRFHSTARNAFVKRYSSSPPTYSNSQIFSYVWKLMGRLSSFNDPPFLILSFYESPSNSRHKLRHFSCQSCSSIYIGRSFWTYSRERF